MTQAQAAVIIEAAEESTEKALKILRKKQGSEESSIGYNDITWNGLLNNSEAKKLLEDGKNDEARIELGMEETQQQVLKIPSSSETETLGTTELDDNSGSTGMCEIF